MGIVLRRQASLNATRWRRVRAELSDAVRHLGPVLVRPYQPGRSEPARPHSNASEYSLSSDAIPDMRA